MTSRRIIELDHRDHEFASRIQRVLFSAYSEEARLINIERFPPLERTASDIAMSENHFLGIVARQDLVGVVELESKEGLDDHLGIASLGVDPQYARQGIGLALIDHVIRFRAPLVTVSTASVNAPAIALYEKVGFQVVKSDTNRHGIPIVHLEKRVAE
ncbi:MAG: GNAT family N-acetyltransferase [Gammaproteobacteria bacterium]